MIKYTAFCPRDWIMEYNELTNGLAEKVAIAGLEVADGATALEIDGIGGFGPGGFMQV